MNRYEQPRPCAQHQQCVRHLYIQAIQDRHTVLILLDRDPLHIDPRRRRVPVRLDDAPCRLAHPAGKRVSCLVQVNVVGTCLSRITWRRHSRAGHTLDRTARYEYSVILLDQRLRIPSTWATSSSTISSLSPRCIPTFTTSPGLMCSKANSKAITGSIRPAPMIL